MTYSAIAPERHSPFASALGWALPLSCVGCQVPDNPLCATCLRRAAGSAPPPRTLPDGTIVFAGSTYADEARRAIVALKTEGFTAIDKSLAVLLDAALAAACADVADDLSAERAAFVARRGAGSRRNAGETLTTETLTAETPTTETLATETLTTETLAAVREREGLVTRRRPVLFVPVPSSRRGFRARGYRPVDRVLGRTGRLATPALAYARQPRDQIGLDADRRAANMRGSMRTARRVAGRTVILIDDVCTTGATLTEAAAVLRAAGARRVCAAVIAATPLRSLLAQPGQTVSDFSREGDYGGAKGVEEPPELSGGTPYRGGRYGN